MTGILLSYEIIHGEYHCINSPVYTPEAETLTLPNICLKKHWDISCHILEVNETFGAVKRILYALKKMVLKSVHKYTYNLNGFCFVYFRHGTKGLEAKVLPHLLTVFYFLYLYNNVYCGTSPASILRKSTSGRHRPVSYPDGPMTARYRFT